MSWIAIKMLLGDRGKYFGIIFGIFFASLLIAQQMSIFCGLMRRTTSQIQDIQGGNIWVMDWNIQFVDDIKPMSENELYRVRGVPGVEWAVKLYKGIARARLSNGNYQQMILIGLDDSTMVGAPREITHGSLADLRKPDAIIMDEAGFKYLWPDETFQPGKEFEMNDRRAVLVGLCQSSPTFQTFPVVYTRFSQATQFVPNERKLLSFILAQSKPGLPVDEVRRQIEEQTHLRAYTGDAFSRLTMEYYLRRTGIPQNFLITVTLGFIVGAAIAGQTFYMFTVENLKQFGALKAMGVGQLRLLGMILLQALVVGVIGYGLGVGAAAGFGELAKRVPVIAFYMPWQVLALTAAAVLLIIMLASLLSMRKVLKLEPAVVFR